MVRRHAADGGGHLPDEIAVEERPRGVAVEHQNRLAAGRALIDVAHPGAPGRLEGLGGERVKARQPGGDGGRMWGGHHSSASIMQLSPLPIPIRATRLPSRTAPASTAAGSVAGRETEPMLPSVSKVEKTFSMSSPSASRRRRRGAALPPGGQTARWPAPLVQPVPAKKSPRGPPASKPPAPKRRPER